MSRDPESGVSLLNVLVVVAAASGLVQVMLSGQQSAVSEVAQAQDVAQAEALARSGVASVAVALRRDMVDAPKADHLQEDWARAAQQAVTFDAGSFAVEVSDPRGRFNINSLTAGAFLEQRIFTGLLNVLDLPETLASQIAVHLQAAGPLRDPRALIASGVSQADLTRLLPHIAAVETPGPINLNTATQPVLAAVLSNPAAAQALAARRKGKGFLDREDFRALGVLVPPAAGFTSDTFDVSTEANVGTATRNVKRRIHRDAERGTLTILPLE